MSVTYYPDLVQRSDEWYAARCGIVTASVIGRLITVTAPGAVEYDCTECDAAVGDPCVSRSRKEPTPIKTFHSARSDEAARRAADAPPVITPDITTDAAESLAFTLAAERITGHVDESRITADMWRGIEEEPIARALYSETRSPVEEMGFVTLESSAGTRVGYSPDGMVDKDGLIEVKSRLNRRQLQFILANRVPTEHMGQLQCGLFVTGRAWIDYVACSGGLALMVKRVEPLQEWHDAIVAAVHRIEARITEIVAKYGAAAAGLPVMDRVPEYGEIEVA